MHLSRTSTLDGALVSALSAAATAFLGCPVSAQSQASWARMSASLGFNANSRSAESIASRYFPDAFIGMLAHLYALARPLSTIEFPPLNRAAFSIIGTASV